jgi:hypothetical protein
MGDGAGPDGHFEGEEWDLVGLTNDREAACCVAFYLGSGKIGRIDNYNGDAYLISYDASGRPLEIADYERGEMKTVKRFIRDSAGKWVRTISTAPATYASGIAASSGRVKSADGGIHGSQQGDSSAAVRPRWWQFWRSRR